MSQNWIQYKGMTNCHYQPLFFWLTLPNHRFKGKCWHYLSWLMGDATLQASRCLHDLTDSCAVHCRNYYRIKTCVCLCSSTWEILWPVPGHFFDNALFPAYRKWGPGTGNVTNRLPCLLFSIWPVQSVRHKASVSFVVIYVWAMSPVSFIGIRPPLLPLIWTRHSKPLLLSPSSWSTRLHWRSGSWRRRWSRPLQLWTRSPPNYGGKAVFLILLLDKTFLHRT